MGPGACFLLPVVVLADHDVVIQLFGYFGGVVIHGAPGRHENSWDASYCLAGLLDVDLSASYLSVRVDLVRCFDIIPCPVFARWCARPVA